MSILKLTYYPEEILKQKTSTVSEITAEIKTLLNNMLETMYYKDSGIGLAAPQVGKDLRVTVLDVSEERNQPLKLINPVITEYSGKVDSKEGCLSIPGFYDTIKRHEKVIVGYLDEDGNSQSIEAEGLLSRALQHEIDHLDGILFIDRLSRLKKTFFQKWYKKNAPFE